MPDCWVIWFLRLCRIRVRGVYWLGVRVRSGFGLGLRLGLGSGLGLGLGSGLCVLEIREVVCVCVPFRVGVRVSLEIGG